MADSEQGGGSWWGGWLETAKAKSSSAVEFLKKDLQEFTNVMKEDTTKAADDVKKQLTQENASAATQKMKDGMSKVIGGISKALVIEPEKEDKPKRGRKPSGEPIFDRAKARLRAVQLDPSTYCDEPDGDPEEFNKWLENFVLDLKKGDISELLVVNVDVRSLYTQLVPSEVSHADFWHRYFYKLHQLDQDEQRKAALMKRADVVQEQLDLEWEDDDWDDIEGPASPPKPTSGNLNAAMVTKTSPEAERDNKEDGCSLETLTEDRRVPENGTPACDEEGTENRTTKNPLQTDETTQQAPRDTAASTENNSSETTNLQSNTSDNGTTKPLDTESQMELKCNVKESSMPHVIDKSALLEPLSVDTDIKTKDKGDMVVVGSERTTPSSDSTTNKESTSLDDDWEKDFDEDIEVTEDDMKLAAEAAKKLAESGADGDNGDDDWENWE